MSTDNSSNKAYEDVLRDHADLRELLAEITEMLAERSVDISAVAAKLGVFGGRLEEHFGSEESSDCFANLVSVAPRVSERIDRLIAEHAQMRIDINELVAYAARCQGETSDWDKVAADFLDFSNRLLDHESRENELVQEVFTDDIGSKD